MRQYRVAFFERLRERLLDGGIDLLVIYGVPNAIDAAKRDAADLAWGTKIRNRTIRVGERSVTWQPCLRTIRGADLIIVEQASRLLLNYVLLGQQVARRRKVAFWGHGKNLRGHDSSALGEWLKRIMSRRVHWWFAYNDMSARIVASLGFPKDRITSVQNAIDTTLLAVARQRLTEDDSRAVREELGLVGDNVCIFVGGLYPEKRLDFLVAACDRIRAVVRDFEMIILGGGPDLGRLLRAAASRPWLHVVGPKFDSEKVRYFAVSKLFLLPGLVGLAVLDAFALGVPLLTTDVPFHSPEIDYLESGSNGLIVPDAEEPAAYAAAVVRLLRDGRLRGQLVEGCLQSARTYTIENMVDRFAAGIEAALSYPA